MANGAPTHAFRRTAAFETREVAVREVVRHLEGWFTKTFHRSSASLLESFHRESEQNLRLRAMAARDEEARGVYDDVARSIRRLYEWGKRADGLERNTCSRLVLFLLERLPERPDATMRALREWEACARGTTRARLARVRDMLEHESAPARFRAHWGDTPWLHVRGSRTSYEYRASLAALGQAPPDRRRFVEPKPSDGFPPVLHDLERFVYEWDSKNFLGVQRIQGRASSFLSDNELAKIAFLYGYFPQKWKGLTRAQIVDQQMHAVKAIRKRIGKLRDRSAKEAMGVAGTRGPRPAANLIRSR